MAALCLLWLIPTLGILVTSFRTLDAVNSSGWWTVFSWPPDLGQLSAASYRQAWSGGMAVSFLNSLAVTLPAVAIPVMIAGLAAYAFAFLRFRAAESCSR
jgi:alpha-glucoside transport system permease protein